MGEVPAPRGSYPLLTKDELEPLVRQAAKGDRDAMDGLLAALKPVVTRYTRFWLGDREFGYFSADDIAQEVCVAVLKALPQYQGRGGSFLYLVHAIAADKVADAFRAVSRDRCAPISDLPERSGAVTDPENHALDADLGERLRQLIHTLPRVQQEIVILRIVVGLSAAETAEAVGLKAGNVRTTQHRALQKLRELITLDGGF
ncbi:RNA polymerase sigma factor ShbA [Amycolatopsis magusensis]|uniref:RNA polymerase sigma factor ShbA n=1 Tax=Amycolatopsis magusensis TaxID=882444 RepID=UPI003C2C89C0